jgi:putative ABC transport system substrate-binding protein
MNRRTFLLAAPICSATALACSGAGQRREADTAYAEIAVSRSKKGGSLPTILVCMPRTEQTQEVWTGLRDELASDFHIVAVEIKDREGAPAIAEGVNRHRPAAIVLMNNPTLAAYREYQRSAADKKFPPAVVVMTSFLQHRPHEIEAATGISYEIPLITVVTNLRKLIAGGIENVGVVVRSPLQGFVAEQAALAAREHITVFPEEVSLDPNAAELKRALRRLKQRVEALWILNDDHLLTPRLITDGWLPGLNERPWVASIVGARSLVSSVQSFGTFAVLPDHTALGAQAANRIIELSEQGFSLAKDAEVQLPLSTTTTVDLIQARERFKLRPDALQRIDRVLQ